MEKIRSCMIVFIAVLLLVICSPWAVLADSSLFGKYRGTVVNNIDPLGMGRIIAAVPEVFGTAVTDWALPAFPFAGLNHGLILVPNVGDGVWVEFEQGDPDYPIWTGSWLSVGDAAIPNLETTRVLATNRGHKILIDDAAGRVVFVHGSGPEMVMTEQDITLKVGSTTLAITADGVYINKKLIKTK